jgi:hypothetical protein
VKEVLSTFAVSLLILTPRITLTLYVSHRFKLLTLLWATDGGISNSLAIFELYKIREEIPDDFAKQV